MHCYFKGIVHILSLFAYPHVFFSYMKHIKRSYTFYSSVKYILLNLRSKELQVWLSEIHRKIFQVLRNGILVPVHFTAYNRIFIK